MRLGRWGRVLRRLSRLGALTLAVIAVPMLSPVGVIAADALPPAGDMAPLGAPSGMQSGTQSGTQSGMQSGGWLGRITMQLEAEAMSDAAMLPDTGSAVVREWRSFDRNGSAWGALVNFAWVILAAALAWIAERAVARLVGWRLRRAMRSRDGGPTVVGLLLLLLCDLAGVAVFALVFVVSRHWLLWVGVTANLFVLASGWLIRWRLVCVVPRIVLRPGEPAARLITIADAEARRLARFLSAVLLAIIVFAGFGDYGLADEDSGAPHIIGLAVALIVCGLGALLVVRARGAAEALIRGRSGGIFGALRAAVARSWLAIGLGAVAALFLFFVFGLSFGLLSYYHAVAETLGVLLVLLVLERLAERGRPAGAGGAVAGRGVERLVAQSLRRVLRALILSAAAMTLAWIWIGAVTVSDAAAATAMASAAAAVATLFVAYIAWELTRLAIDRQLPSIAGPRLPGEEDEEATPGSRLQTILPMLRAAFGILIAVVVTLIVLSRLGVDTAPLIAGAGVFGLAISFGAQSLVRDIISGLFYLWDDAFRVGEYIDTGRLKGTVEALGIRSVKLRHHNGPLHTIPYGQLGAVTNLSRDFATIKFNLRLERSTDIELVRRTAKRIGLDLQQNPEIAAEVMLPLKLQGIAEVSDTALVLRFKFTARPVKPSWVQREYLKAMYRVFADKGIVFAVGTLTLQSATLQSPTLQSAVLQSATLQSPPAQSPPPAGLAPAVPAEAAPPRPVLAEAVPPTRVA